MRSARDLDPGDITLLQAAAMTQRQTGVAISLHSPRSGINDVSAVPAILDVLDILADAGADLSRVVVGHADRTTFETAKSLAAIAARGPYIQFDGWGWEGYISLDSWAPSDEYRFRLTRGLIALGLERQLLLSQDVCEKRQWRAFGGRGYGHVLTFVAPLLRHNGVSEATIERLFVENPARMLTIAPPRDVRGRLN